MLAVAGLRFLVAIASERRAAVTSWAATGCSVGAAGLVLRACKDAVATCDLACAAGLFAEAAVAQESVPSK